MQAEDYFKGGKVRLWREKFAIIKSKGTYPEAFANIIDRQEITVVIDQKKYQDKDVLAAEKDFRLLSFELTLPFGLVGFLAKISAALAVGGISIFVISAYSTDHILVREKDLKRTKAALSSLGFLVLEK